MKLLKFRFEVNLISKNQIDFNKINNNKINIININFEFKNHFLKSQVNPTNI